MQQEGIGGMKSPACEEIEPLLILFAAGELDASEMAEVDEHLAALFRLQPGDDGRK